jgi:hypothetical protein
VQCFSLSSPTNTVIINFTGCGDQILVDYMQSGQVHIDRIVPNPAKDIVRVEGRGLSVQGVEVYDMLGRQIRVPVSVAHGLEAGLELDVRDIPEGLYYLRLGQASVRFEILR